MNLRPQLVAATERGLRWVVIGGHAVWLSGFQRTTQDIDFLIRRNDLKEWTELLVSAGYQTPVEHPGFAQFASTSGSGLDVDLMLVNDSTFDKIHAASISTTWFGMEVRIPAPEHLIALKVHALKNAGIERRPFDLIDILQLSERLPMEGRLAKLREICDQFGSDEIYERLQSHIH